MRESRRQAWIVNARILTMDGTGREMESGCVLIEDGRIAEVREGFTRTGDVTVWDAEGAWLLPGFVQPHVHLCQTLFRGMAEEMRLLDWLRERIWPLEAAHDEASMEASVTLGVRELLAGGTTTVMDMASVHHTDVVLETVDRLGLRAHIGKAMMEPGKAVPPDLSETGDRALASSVDLASSWHGRGRLSWVYSPRFLLSVSEGLLVETAAEARRIGCLMQTHSSENPDEVREALELTGLRSLAFLEKTGFVGEDVVLAHMIHLDDDEMDILERTGTAVAHCPGSNCKLGSGVADVPAMRRRGVRVGIAADGAPCNNGMSMLREMRLAAQLQSLVRGPGVMPAREIVRMATMGGAEALGMQDEIGSIEPGKLADLVLLAPGPHTSGGELDPCSRIVWAMDDRDVTATWVEGEMLWDGRAVRGIDDVDLEHTCSLRRQDVASRLDKST